MWSDRLRARVHQQVPYNYVHFPGSKKLCVCPHSLRYEVQFIVSLGHHIKELIVQVDVTAHRQTNKHKKEMSLERNKEKKKSNNQLFQTSTRVQTKRKKEKEKDKREK